MAEFQVKDSGKRQSFDSGMVRDVEGDKIDYTRVYDGPMLDRWADHITKGAVKYPNLPDLLPKSRNENMSFKVAQAPRLAYCLLDDEESATWFITIDNGRTFVRAGGDWVTVTQDRLVLVSNGKNDVGFMADWPRQLQSRFQPHRV